MENQNRLSIILDTTRSVYPVLNPFGDDPNEAGWYIATRCPVHGQDILPTRPFDTFEKARAAIADLYA